MVRVARVILIVYYVVVAMSLIALGKGMHLVFWVHLFSSIAAFGVIAHFARICSRGLAKYHGPQTLGPILEASLEAGLFFGGWREIKQYLTTQLLALKASDSHFLEPRHREELRRILSSDESFPLYGRITGRPLKKAILAAIEQIGDTKAIPTVKRMAEKSADQEVKSAAHDCLVSLQERAKTEIAGMRLLRPAESVSSGVLLQPAKSNTEEAEVLLRPEE